MSNTSMMTKYVADFQEIPLGDLDKISGGGDANQPACKCESTRSGELSCHDANGRVCGA